MINEEKNNKRLHELKTEFLNQYDNQNTRDNYNSALKYFLEFIESQNMDFPNKEDINKILISFRNFLSEEKISDSSINQYMRNLNKFFKYININNVKIPLIKNNIDINDYQYVNRREINGMIEAISSMSGNQKQQIKYKSILLTIFFTGLSATELINIKLKDIYFKNSDVKYFNNYILLNNKKSKVEKVGFNEITSESLKKLIKVYEINNSDNYIFTNYQGNQITIQGISKIIKKIAIATDTYFNITDKNKMFSEKISFKSLNDSLAIYLLNDLQYDIYVVYKIMRHKNIDITRKFLFKEKENIVAIQNGIK